MTKRLYHFFFKSCKGDGQMDGRTDRQTERQRARAHTLTQTHTHRSSSSSSWFHTLTLFPY